jgi:hypothetical protein
MAITIEGIASRAAAEREKSYVRRTAIPLSTNAIEP